VSFGTGLHQWGFTLVHFASLYGEKFGIPNEVMLKNLWGERFYNPATKKFVNSSAGGKLARGFVHFILDPIYKLFNCVMEETMFFSKKAGKDVLTCWKMFKQLGINLKQDERELRGKELLKRAMQKWLPVAEALMEMIVLHLPSPAKAQTYRMDLLYEGPVDDRYAAAMKTCDRDGPLMMYISKMVPTTDAGRFIAFGRVFSGIIATGKKCRICGPNYVPGDNKDMVIKPIQRTVIMMGRTVDQVVDVPCGNTCGLVGVDQYILKTGTIMEAEAEDCHNIKVMKFSVSPVVRVAVQPLAAGDLPKLVEGLKRLAKSDPMVQISHEPSGEHVVAGAGELHLEICLKDLQDDFMKGTRVKISPPVVPFRETITERSPQCLSKSPNKHNRLYMYAEPLDSDLVKDIDDGKCSIKMEKKELAQFLSDGYGMDKKECEKIWAFGPETEGPNMLRDVCKGVQYLAEIKEQVNAGFQWATKTGPLCDEQIRACSFNLEDVTLHADSIHRGIGQIMPRLAVSSTPAS
jgi:elongation factor 2